MKAFNIWSKLFVFGALFIASCADEDEINGLLPDGRQGGITISAVCHDMLPEALLTRAGATEVPKTAKEKQINTLHLFFFDAAGNFLTPESSEKFSPYYRLEVNDPQGNGEKQAALTISNNTFVNQNTLDNVTVYAVANVYGHQFRTTWTPNGDIVHGDEQNAQAEVPIENLNSLKKWYYRPTPRKDISKLPDPGMPMVGITTGVDLSQGNKTIQINMQALMARVDVSVQLDANQTNNDGTLPKLQITEYGVRNMPYSVPFSPVAEGGSTVIPDIEGIDKDPNDYIARERVVSYEGPVLYDGQKAATFTYYTYENVQQPTTSRPDYPNGVDVNDESVIQRWKRTIANKNASAVVMKGEYVTHQGLTYKAEFNIYMGSNTYNNFEVRRNRCYKNNISIRGLDYVRNSDPNVYNFDGRVNVVTDNPLYLAIVNERKVDAHATALPMDVWLLLREPQTPGSERPVVSHQTKVTVSILNPEATKWIRMDKIPRSTMEANGFKAGTGCLPYFTTDLVSNTLADNTEIIIDTKKGDDSRTRIYFYIDENVPQSANADVPDRKAYIKVRYENTLGDVRERVLEIEQRGMLRVTVAHPSNSVPLENVYIEYYEEYLSHNDPLDQHEQPGAYYSGLPWGPTRRFSSYLTADATEIYDEGLDMTNRVLTNSESGSITNIKLYMEEPPESAFHYCYGKNKRNSDGSVPTFGTKGYWYMPGIRELERALVQYYLTFADFQGNFYWSASAAKANLVSEAKDRARATKVNPNSNPMYIESGWTNKEQYPTGGNTPRNMALRIRAFYKYNP